ncbi:MAG TPA: response regulator [Deltaproteobacteria bacterium]|nr:response regulator [Deltaproteobacteria bacterium]HIJ36799.1 response regulator [Deltaproteobacteria bacterium]
MTMCKIMIAEDNIISSMDLEELLSAQGHQVVGVAASGMEAVQMGETLAPDLILMEINMPGIMNGVAAAEAIRSTRDIPIFFLMGDAREELVNRAKTMTPYDLIRKPFGEEQVAQAINAAFAGS